MKIEIEKHQGSKTSQLNIWTKNLNADDYNTVSTNNTTLDLYNISNTFVLYNHLFESQEKKV